MLSKNSFFKTWLLLVFITITTNVSTSSAGVFGSYPQFHLCLSPDGKTALYLYGDVLGIPPGGRRITVVQDNIPAGYKLVSVTLTIAGYGTQKISFGREGWALGTKQRFSIIKHPGISGEKMEAVLTGTWIRYIMIIDHDTHTVSKRPQPVETVTISMPKFWVKFEF